MLKILRNFFSCVLRISSEAELFCVGKLNPSFRIMSAAKFKAVWVCYKRCLMCLWVYSSLIIFITWPLPLHVYVFNAITGVGKLNPSFRIMSAAKFKAVWVCYKRCVFLSLFQSHCFHHLTSSASWLCI